MQFRDEITAVGKLRRMDEMIFLLEDDEDLLTVLCDVIKRGTGKDVLKLRSLNDLRAHKQEVLFINSLVGAIAVALSTFIVGRHYGAAGIVISCCILNFGGLIWATYKFRKYRTLWHAT